MVSANKTKGGIMAKSKLNPKLWKCVGSFVENVPICKTSIVACLDDNRLTIEPYGNYYLCKDCDSINKKQIEKAKLRALKSIIELQNL